MSPPEKLSHLIAVWDLIVVSLATVAGTLAGWAIKLLREIKTEIAASGARIHDRVAGVETQLRVVNGRLGKAEQRLDDNERFCDERTERVRDDIARLELRTRG